MGLSLGPTGEFVATMFSPFWGNSPETVVAQTIAEEFGIDPAQVTVTYEDSQHGLPGAGPGGSRMAVMLTGATAGAAGKLKDKLARIAAHQFEAAPEDIVFADGKAMVRGLPDKAMTYAELGLKAYWFKLDLPAGMESGLEARHTYDHPYLTLPSADRKDLGAFYPIMAHGAHIPVVEVNPDTGQVTILRYVAVHDVGTVINPKSLRGQITGGITQGIGMALYEQYRYDADGQPLTGQLHGLSAAHRQRGAGLRDRPRGDAVALHPVRREGRRRGRPHDRAGGAGQRRGGRSGPARRPIDELPMTPERLADLVEAARGGR